MIPLFQFPSKFTISTFIAIISKSELCNRSTYIREFKLTFAFKKYTRLCELKSRGPLRMLKISSDPAFLNFEVSLTELHTSHEQFSP